MKKALLLLALIYSTNAFAEIIFDLRGGKPGYEVVMINGIECWVAPEVSEGGRAGLTKYQKSFITKTFKETQAAIPKTYSEFQRRKYKVFLLHEPKCGNGLEFIRPGQHKWDRRIPRNGSMTKSIFILRTKNFCKGSMLDIFYFLHEMVHFRHLVLDWNRNTEITKSYNAVVIRGGKFKGMYASKNYLEYFADISATYLLPSHLVPRSGGFPKGAGALRTYSPNAYILCKNFWENEKPDFKPRTKTEPRVDDIMTAQKKKQPISFPKGDYFENKEAWRLYIHIGSNMRQAYLYEQLAQSTGSSSHKQRMWDLYSNAYQMAQEHKKKFPLWKDGGEPTVDQLKKQIKQKIDIFWTD